MSDSRSARLDAQILVPHHVALLQGLLSDTPGVVEFGRHRGSHGLIIVVELHQPRRGVIVVEALDVQVLLGGHPAGIELGRVDRVAQVLQRQDLGDALRADVVNLPSVSAVHGVVADLNRVVVRAAVYKVRVLPSSQLVWTRSLDRNQVRDHLAVHVVALELSLRESSRVEVLALSLDGLGHGAHGLPLLRLSSRVHLDGGPPVVADTHTDLGGLEALVQRVDVLLLDL